MDLERWINRLLKAMGVFFALVIATLVGLIFYAYHFLPKVAPADETLKIEATPARLKRGKYLAQHVAGCMGCHSHRDFNVYGEPVIPGTEFEGGEPLFTEVIGLPGELPPPNLTPYNLGRYSDGELVRVIRTGVRKNGEPLFPFMPYQHYAHMTQADLDSVIVYLRSLPSIKNDVPDHHLEPPLGVIVRTIPKDAGPYPAPVDPKQTVAYGRYLVTLGACMDCHSPVDGHHHPIPGMDFAGGMEIPYFNSRYQRNPQGGVLRVPNITPDKDTGIGAWTRADFIARFAAWRGKKGLAKEKRLDLDKGDYVELMPYLEYSGMTDADLGAIYDYLRSVAPVRNKVVKFTPPKAL